MPRAQALISPDDRGFRFGDGIFETIAITSSQLYLWDAHLTRLQDGLALLHIRADTSNLREQVTHLITRNAITEGMCRIMITRGAGSQGYLPTHSGQPTIYIETLPTSQPIATSSPPISLWVSQWQRFAPDMLPTHTKIMQGMNATLARMEAAEHGCDEALLLSADGKVSEAASGNLFWLRDDILHTPALSTGALKGTMRGRLMELWPDTLIECTEPLGALRDADALIMTNAVRGAVAVKSLTHAAAIQHFEHSEDLAAHCNALIQKDIATILTNP